VTVITLNRTGGSDGAVSVKVTPTDGTALSSTDYTNTPITVNFADKETSKTVTIPINNDTVYEPDETLNLTLSNPTGGVTLGTQKTAIVTITNDDPKVTVIIGGDDDDSLFGKDGNNILYGKGGNDALYGGEGNDTLYGEEGNDTLYGIEGNNTLYGGKGNDTLYGGEGNDTLYGEEGNDTLYGIEGNDTLYGGEGNDKLYGGFYGDKTLDGGKGDDLIYGGNNNDIIYGGEGNDTLSGGLGSDLFVFNSLTDGKARITDFSVADDTIQVSRAGFSETLTIGTLSPTAFIRGTAATTPNHRFIYNSQNGFLLFDSDGTGSQSSIEIATLNTGLGITNADIVVIA
ncbi:calcium-binding protein, partial [Aphanothece sacrum]